MIEAVYSQRDFSGGLNTTAKPWQVEDNELPYAVGMVVSAKGSIASSYGHKSAGAAATSILGLFPFYYGANRYLVRMFGTSVEYTADPLVASPTWTAVETLSTTGGRFTAVQYDDKLWYGDAINNFRRWTGSAVTEYASAPKGNISTVWRSQCWISGVTANPSTLYYSSVADFTTWSGGTSGSISINLQDGEKITGTVPLGDTLIVFKERSIWKVTYDYDDVTGTNLYNVAEVSSHKGCIAPRTALLVNNDATALSNFGVVTAGAEANYSGLRTNVLSEDIRGDLKTASLGGALNSDNANLSSAIFFEDRLYMSVPIDTANYPSATYLYDSLYEAWVYLEGVSANIFAIYRASVLEDYLFFGDSDGGVYYFSIVHSQNDAAFTKKFRTKINDLGNPGVKKEIHAIVISGTKSQGSTIDCIYTRDYTEEPFTITDADLVQDSQGGYVGENTFGDNYFGSLSVSDGIPQYRYRKTFFPDERGCFEYQLEFSNETADEPYSVDSIQVPYGVLDLQENLPS